MNSAFTTQSSMSDLNPFSSVTPSSTIEGHKTLESRSVSPLSCPFGYPLTIPLKSITDSLLKYTNLYSKYKDKKDLKPFRSKEAPPSEVLRKLPIDRNDFLDLSPRNRMMAGLTLSPSIRRYLLDYLVVKNKSINVSPEGMLLRNYLKQRHKGTVFCSMEQFGDLFHHMDSVTPEHAFEDQFMGALCASSQTTNFLASSGLGSLACALYAYAYEGVWSKAYEDLLADGEHSDLAAGAIFAATSILNNRLPLDYVYQKAPDVFKKHFSALIFDPYAHAGEDGSLSDLAESPKYKNLGTNLLSDSFEEQVSKSCPFFPVYSAITHLHILMDHSVLSLEPSSPVNEAMRVFAEQSNRQTFDNVIAQLEEVKEAAARTAIRKFCAALASTKAVVEQLNSNFDDLAPESFKHSWSGVIGDIAATLSAVSDCDPDHVESDDHEKIADLQKMAEQMLEDFTDAADTIESFKGTIKQLATEDPIKNRDPIERAYQQISEVSEGVQSDELATLVDEMHLLSAQILERFETTTHHETDTEDQAGEPSVQEQGDRPHDERIQQLEKELAQASSTNEALRHSLAEKRKADSQRMIHQDVRQLIETSLTTPSELTPSECLFVLQSIHEDVEILHSAWESAEKVSDFKRSDALFSALLTLAGDYRRAILSGKPDAEARNFFPNNMFAANESETVSSGETGKQREFYYNGQKHFFGKHLRIGVADDPTITIRVHFDIFDGVLVIATCGTHLKIS